MKNNNQFKKRKQPELPEDQTACKSDNQGVKEPPFIQTGRKGGDRKPGWKGQVPRQGLADWEVPHWRADKPGGITGEQDRLCNPRF